MWLSLFYQTFIIFSKKETSMKREMGKNQQNYDSFSSNTTKTKSEFGNFVCQLKEASHQSRLPKRIVCCELLVYNHFYKTTFFIFFLHFLRMTIILLNYIGLSCLNYYSDSELTRLINEL